MAVQRSKTRVHIFSWRVLILLLFASKRDSLCFSAQSGSSLLPSPGVILDFGKLLTAGVNSEVVEQVVAEVVSVLFGMAAFWHLSGTEIHVNTYRLWLNQLPDIENCQ